MTKIPENYKLRKSDDRGIANHGWLDVRFTFSFADYYDPQHMFYRSLRVMNNDRINPGKGFGMHPHKNMEIISYIIEGELQHKDNMGNGSIIQAGNVQKITAGKGIVHSEFNPSKDKHTLMYQIWIMPNENDLTPSYQELTLKNLKSVNGLKLFATNDKKDGVLYIHQDAYIFFGSLDIEEQTEFVINKGRGVWIQIIDGTLTANNIEISKGDGLAVDDVEKVTIKALSRVEFLLFDLV